MLACVFTDKNHNPRKGTETIRNNYKPLAYT